MVIQYLHDCDYSASFLTLQDEANLKIFEQIHQRSHIKYMGIAILEGDWAEVDKLANKHTFSSSKSFLYALYKQQYLELIEKQEYQKAFTLLNKKLKLLERYATNPAEFKDLCFLLTCKSVQDAPSFRNWDGAKGSSRELLLEQFRSTLQFSNRRAEATKQVPPNRLLHLLRQAVAYQIEFSRYHPKVAPKIHSLLEDYSPFVLPNSLRAVYNGHKDAVKCIDFVGVEGTLLASGASDNTVRVWSTHTPKESGEHVQSSVLELKGHSSRVWDVSSSFTGRLLASASGDATVKVWDLSRITGTTVPVPQTLKGHKGDVYTVKFHPNENHVVTGGYDKTVRLFDVRTGVQSRSFVGHSASVSCAIFNPHGNLVISGSKDNTIKYWDIASGLCIKTYSTHLGEVTSIASSQNGSLLLSASKDNSNRLWDVRTARPIRRFKGHQNTSKNFMRVAFGPNEALVLGGSEDGLIYVWDIETANILHKLGGHDGMVYSAKWHAQQSLIASCSDDKTVRLWWYDESKPMPGTEQQLL
eukprot:TRINITY_DN7906_c0_g1_i1.p1 TRINITY_DN7906_c0_g1~~TRINITY_DN7906_c0_g1_i1.p1  ORF type:complete len:601 (+),score=60.46 TRINITY_DN7906_c0_g1_i1:221-1804(+)